MWGRMRRANPSTPLAGATTDDRRRRLVTRAFQELAGTANGVVYDLERTSRPERIPGSIYLKGSPAWRSYLDAREQADGGQPAILFSLRVLDDDERNLAVEWGTTYPNTFFLVEPHDWRCDLSDPANSFHRLFRDAVETTLDRYPSEVRFEEFHTAQTPLGAVMREVFGTWVYWAGPRPYGQTEEVALELSGNDETVWQRLLAELGERFPQPAFDRALAYVNDWEQELLGGPVPRARSVFRTRLGMPILSDARRVDRAVRRLANEGRMTVIGASLPGRPIYGRGRPVPDEISEEEFVHFLMG